MPSFPLTLIERLATLIPRPRVNLTTYHGVFAPAASYRDRIVPEPPPDENANLSSAAQSCPHATTSTDPTPATDPSPPSSLERLRPQRRRYSWAELMKRIFLTDVLSCPHCGGRRKVLTFLTDPDVIRKILRHLGLATEPPPIAAARPPPELAFEFA